MWFLGFQIQFSVYDFIFETVFMMYETDYEERRDPPPRSGTGVNRGSSVLQHFLYGERGFKPQVHNEHATSY